jgi:putative transposase
MARWAVQDKSVSIVLACATFRISETCYRYRSMRNDENEEISDWLLRLTACHKPEPLAVPERPNDTWSMDFMADRLTNGRSFRTFNVLDDFNREGLEMNDFATIKEAQLTATQWLWIYNNERPSMALGGITPAMKLAEAFKLKPSTANSC